MTCLDTFAMDVSFSHNKLRHRQTDRREHHANSRSKDEHTRRYGSARRRHGDRLTVHCDADLSFVVSSVGVDLSAARILAVISCRDVRDPQTLLLHELVPSTLCNNDVITQLSFSLSLL